MNGQNDWLTDKQGKQTTSSSVNTNSSSNSSLADNVLHDINNGLWHTSFTSRTFTLKYAIFSSSLTLLLQNIIQTFKDIMLIFVNLNFLLQYNVIRYFLLVWTKNEWKYYTVYVENYEKCKKKHEITEWIVFLQVIS